jgi:predicted acylesterase/phospholipase RssA
MRESGLKARRAGTAAAVQPPFQILCLSGGGYRGFLTATILEQLEEQSGGPLRDRFDLIAGTSIGGIVACGIAAGVAASEIRKQFEAKGAAIFEKRLGVFGISVKIPRFGILGARYSRAGLEGAIAAALGDTADLRVAELAKPLIVPAVSATNGTTVLFDNGSRPTFPGATLRQAALATSAAPTYFPDFDLEGNSLVDGGIVANAPDAVAVMKAMTAFGRDRREIRMLSIGTAGDPVGEVHKSGRASGALGWMIGRNLFGLTVAAQQSLAIDLVRDLLGGNYVRIDAVADRKRSKAIALDRADRPATETLRELAREALEEARRTRGGDIAAMLRHEPTQAHF